MRKSKSVKDKQIQTGRTLPSKYNSYVPGKRTDAQHSLPSVEPIMPDARRWKRIVGRCFLFLLALILVSVLFVGIWDARNISRASEKMFGSGSLFDLLSRDPYAGSERGRVNILLIGYSVDDPGHPAAKLTDSIMLLSMNTTNHTGYILSIPRDLYVNISGNGYGKINEAYQDGGTQLLEQIVSRNFQTPIDYYVLINYSAVRGTVDALGGIKVVIHSSDPRGLYDPNINRHDGGPLKLTNGPHSLSGQTALNLTRARGDDYRSYGFAQADFDRTQHQRQVLTAIKNELDWKLILNPTKNEKILTAVSENVKTDIKATQIRVIFGLFNSIPSANLKSISLRDFNGKNYLASYTTPYGQSALIPARGIGNYSDIDAVIARLNRQ